MYSWKVGVQPLLYHFASSKYNLHNSAHCSTNITALYKELIEKLYKIDTQYMYKQIYLFFKITNYVSFFFFESVKSNFIYGIMEGQ